MEYILAGLVSFAIPLLALVSGFGLGTLLLPTFAIFFQLPVAIAMAAGVHLLNSLFHAIGSKDLVNRKVLVLFAVTAVPGAALGAFLFSIVAMHADIFQYNIAGMDHGFSLVKAIVGLCIVAFSLIEINPQTTAIRFDRQFIPLGGFISGFFGGLAGIQSALRHPFLAKAQLSREAANATGAACACVVDTTRLIIYGFLLVKLTKTGTIYPSIETPMILLGLLLAFGGSWFGGQMIRKVLYKEAQLVTLVLLLTIGVMLMFGLI